MFLEVIPKALYLMRNMYGQEDQKKLFSHLLNTIPWEQRYIKIANKNIPEPRLTSWHGDKGASYTYSGIQLKTTPWTDHLLSIKTDIESITRHTFNSVLLNLYRTGSDSVGWHADNENSLGEEPIIASLSLGVARKFVLKEKKAKNNNRVELYLHSGDLLLMKGKLQENYLHCLPKIRGIKQKRINLTFRYIYS